MPIKSSPQTLRSLAPADAEYYAYRDATGRCIYRRVRSTTNTYRTEHLNRRGEWRRGYGAALPLLFQLPQILQAPFDQPILLVEREADALVLGDYGWIATTCPGGPQGLQCLTEQARQVLKGRPVIVLPRRGRASAAFAKHAQVILSGVAQPLAIVHLPDLCAGEGILDWLTFGHYLDELSQLIHDAMACPSVGDSDIPVPLSEAAASRHLDLAPFIWVPNFVEMRAVRRALTDGFTMGAAGYPSCNLAMGDVEISVELRPRLEAGMTNLEVLALAHQHHPWWSTAVSLIMAMMFERAHSEQTAGPVYLSLEEIAQALGIATKDGALQLRDRRRLQTIIQVLRVLYLTGSHIIKRRGIPDELPVSAYLVALTEDIGPTRSGASTTQGIYLVPGDWHQDYDNTHNRYFTAVNRRLFQVDPVRWRVTAIGLHVAERLRLDPEFIIGGLKTLTEDIMAGAGGPQIDKNPTRYVMRHADDFHALRQFSLEVSHEEPGPDVPYGSKARFSEWKQCVRTFTPTVALTEEYLKRLPWITSAAVARTSVEADHTYARTSVADSPQQEWIV